MNQSIDQNRPPIVLIVDDVLTNLAVIHDALDESGYTVLVAGNGKSALKIAKDAQPDVILLDAIMPEMDGFEVCKALKMEIDTRHIPVIFMTGLTEVEHVTMAFQVGGIDYVTKPVRPRDVLARVAAHMQTAKMMHQARTVMDAFGQAAIAITLNDGKLVWQTPLARKWMQTYFPTETESSGITPSKILNWLNEADKTQELQALNIIQGGNRLILTLSENQEEEQIIIYLREESDAAQIEALMLIFNLTKRESEVLYWVTKGKTSRDIGDILETSSRTINKHLEHVYVKMGVETRTAAASLAMSKLRIKK
jgi:CheY-like chemotaxis protein/DNA-binding CsgD family transcriptional regulator